MRKLYLLLIPAAILAGCSKNNTLRPDNGVLTPLAVNSSSIAAVITKADVAITTGGKIGIFQTTSANGYTVKNNIEYDYINGTGKWTLVVPADQVYLNNNTASICAYYPFDAANTAPASIAMATQLYSAAKDLCYATVLPVNNAAPTANFTMRHAYAQVTLIIRKDVTYTGTGAINEIKITNPGIKATNTLNNINGIYGTPVAGNFTGVPSIASLVTYDATTPATILATTTLAQILMVPVITAMTTDITLSLKVDGIILTADVPVASLPQLIAGSNYSITVMILGNKLSIGNIAVTDWIPSVIAAPIYPQAI